MTSTEDPWDEFGKPATADQMAPDEDEDIFGDVDVNEVGDNPFDVADGTYRMVCTGSKITQKEGDERRWLVHEWTVDDEESEYYGMKLRDQNQLPPRGVKYKDLTPAQKKSLKFFKMKMRQAFDFSETQLSTFKPSDCLDKVAMGTVVHNQGKGENADKSYANVDRIICMRLFEERNQQRTSAANEAAKSVGL